MKLNNEQLNIDCLKIEPENICRRIQNFLEAEVWRLKRNGVIIGISGGLDSSVVASLCVRALGKDKVLGLIMPERDSHPQNKKDARELAELLGIKTYTINLTPLLRKIGAYSIVPGGLWLPYLLPRSLRERYVKERMESFKKSKGQTIFSQQLLSTIDEELGKGFAFYRIKHRLRMILLYYHAEINNLLVAGTGNKSEILTGFYVKYGDGAADIMPIQNLYKTQVRQLAKFLNIPERIINKPPSPDLIPGVTDEFAIGLSFDELDLILFYLEKDLSSEQISEQTGIDIDKVNYVITLKENSRHMRELPPSPIL